MGLVKICIKERGYDMDWFQLPQDKVPCFVCEHGNEILGFTEGWEFLDQLSDSQLLNKDIKLSLCLTKNHAMKTYWGVEV
jgi:hypothetical protein